jgi:SAM-dependent methyltransferase
MKIRARLLRIHWLLSAQFGIDPIKMLRGIRSLPRYIAALIRARSIFTKTFELMPCLHDWHEEGGATKNEYFWQDLLVARKIFAAKPDKHVDIGSRVDGFVAHVASFREIEVIDIRPITTKIPGMTFKQVDMMNPAGIVDYCDSLSSLHALEHFGLGRYGDPIDPKGYESGIRNMARILRSGGTFYLSVPVGAERVEFNAQHVFDPCTIMEAAKNNRLRLHEFALFSQDSGWVEMDASLGTLEAAGKKRYGLGIFTFIKD